MFIRLITKFFPEFHSHLLSRALIQDFKLLSILLNYLIYHKQNIKKKTYKYGISVLIANLRNNDCLQVATIPLFISILIPGNLLIYYTPSPLETRLLVTRSIKCSIYTFNTVMYTGNAGRRPKNRAELSGHDVKLG